MIYGVYLLCVLWVYWMVEELGIFFKVVKVMQVWYFKDFFVEDVLFNMCFLDFFVVNFLVQIFVIDDDGFVLIELFVIMFYFVKKYGGEFVLVDIVEEGEMLCWMFWVVIELELQIVQIVFVYDVGQEMSEGGCKMIVVVSCMLKMLFLVLELYFVGCDYFVGDCFIVVDINVVEVLCYVMGELKFFEDKFNICVWYEVCYVCFVFEKMMVG